MQHHFAQHRGHDARRALADHILHVRKIFLQHAPFIVGHAREVARGHAHTVIGEDAICRRLFDQRDFRRPQRYRQIRRQLRCDAKPVGVFDHGFDAHFVRQLQRRDITRLRQRPPQRYDAFKFFVVVVRRVRPGGRIKADGLIENGVIGAGALVDDGRVNVRFERRPNLAHSLRGAVKFRIVEIAPTHQRFDPSSGVVDRQQRTLRAGILFQADTGRAVRTQRKNPDVANIAGFENVGEFLLRPSHVGLTERGGIFSKLQRGDARARRGHQRVDISIHFRFVVPVGMRILVENRSLGHYIFQMPLPSMPPFISCHAVEHSLIRGLLHIHIEGGVNLQAAFMNLVGSVLVLEVAANLFHKIW